MTRTTAESEPPLEGGAKRSGLPAVEGGWPSLTATKTPRQLAVIDAAGFRGSSTVGAVLGGLDHSGDEVRRARRSASAGAA